MTFSLSRLRLTGMRAAIVACLFLVLTPLEAFTSDDGCGARIGAWSICEHTEDCVVVADVCGHPVDSVNKRFQKEIRTYNSCKGAVLDCAEYQEARDGKFTAACAGKRCMPVRKRK